MSLNFVYVYSLGMRKTVIVATELKEKQDENIEKHRRIGIYVLMNGFG